MIYDRAALEEFIARIEDFDDLSDRQRVDHFVYYLTNDRGLTAVKPADVHAVFRAADLPPYPRTGRYLNEQSQRRRSNGARYVHTRSGYSLVRRVREEIAGRLQRGVVTHDVSHDFRDLTGKLAAATERDFLQEAVRCYEARAYRAAIIMTWIVTLDYLYEHVLAHKLAAFNTALSSVKDKRVKTSFVGSKDDFSDIPESNFITICRTARIISNDVRKILDQKLETRNSAAHPSVVKIAPVKAAEFIQDLVHNVILKYPV